MDIQQISRRTEVQVLAVFGILVLGGYYIYRKRFVDSVRWAKAVGRSKPVAQEKSVLLDLFVGKNATNACQHTVRGPIGYLAGLDNNPFVVGKRWFTNFERQINYPNGVYALYNPSNSLSGKWAKIVNGIVAEVGTCTSPTPTLANPRLGFASFDGSLVGKVNPCPNQEIPCANNSSICFNPKVKYDVDPCSTNVNPNGFGKR